MKKDKQSHFWNDAEMVAYFASKPADPLIVNRLKKVNDANSKYALDLGCGGGRHTELLAQLGFKVTALDINPAMIAYTQNRLSEKDLDATMLLSSITDLNFKNRSFDVVVSTGVLHQVTSLHDYKELMTNLFNIMKPGGLLTINIFTNAIWDRSYTVPNLQEPYTVLTKEGLYMTILPKELFYSIARNAGFMLEEECSETIKKENTGDRAVLKAHLIKPL